VNIIYLLLPLALLMVFVFVLLYLWAVRRDQFDDLETPARRMLLDDSPPPNPDHSTPSMENRE